MGQDKVVSYVREMLKESSLSRVQQHLIDNDCAIVTAFRGGFTKQQNLDRNHELRSALLGANFGVTAMDGSFIENYGSKDAKEVSEQSFLVVNLHKNPEFKDIVIQLGKHYNQDSVLLKEAGKEDAYLYGTNDSNSPGLDKTHSVGVFKGGINSKIMSKIGNRPFVFEASSDYNIMTRGYIFDRTFNKIFGIKEK